MKKTVLTFALLALPAAFAASPESKLVVDRGLPQANLNNSSGDARSNVRFSLQDSGFAGDDFVIGAAGEKWEIDAIRTWAVPDLKPTSTQHLGDLFQDVRLYLGSGEGSVTPIVSGMLSPGSDDTDAANIRISDATASGAIAYDNAGTDLRIYQIEFANLHKVVEGGVKQRFGVMGMGRAVPGNAEKSYAWFNHGSHAPLSATQQDGADGSILLFGAGGKFDQAFQSKNVVWDKSSDINVQVFAHRVVR